MSDCNKISIIMPAYNTEKYVSDAIESVLNQTYENWELLAIDDGSIDSTGNIIASYAEKDKRIRVFHTENKGVSHARNVGLDNASGEWISFLDSDDFLMPDALHNFLSAADEKELVVGNYCTFPQKIRKKQLTDRNNISNTELVRSFTCMGAVWGMLFRKDAIKERLTPGLQFGEDALFFYGQLRNCTHIATIHNVVYQYRRSDMSTLSRQGNITFYFVETLCSIMSDYFNEDSAKVDYYSCVAHYYLYYVKNIVSADKLTKTEKKARIAELLKSRNFCEMPLMRLKIKKDDMHLFLVMKTMDMTLIEKELKLE